MSNVDLCLMTSAEVTKFSHCLIDISGSREIEIILKLVEKYQAVFDPSLILVRRLKLIRQDAPEFFFEDTYRL